MALSANNDGLVWQPRADTISIPLANNVTFYRRGFVGIDRTGATSGYLVPWTGPVDQSEIFVGLLIGGDYTEEGRRSGNLVNGQPVLIGDTGADNVPEGVVLHGGVTLMGVAVADTSGTESVMTQADVGATVYSTDDDPDNLSMNSVGNGEPIGIITRFNSTTSVDVTLFSMMEAQAQQLAEVS